MRLRQAVRRVLAQLPSDHQRGRWHAAAESRGRELIRRRLQSGSKPAEPACAAQPEVKVTGHRKCHADGSPEDGIAAYG